MNAVAGLELGREAYASQAWSEAHEGLSEADRAEPLEAEDLELLATSAYMIGRGSEYLDSLERAYRAYLETGERLRAFRCAFWIGINLAQRGEMARANGWLGRAQRLLDREGGDRVEHGYLLLPEVFELEASGDWESAAATAGKAAEIAERFGDPDLFGLVVHERGHILIREGRLKEGLGLLDEAMVAVIAGEVSPIVSGIVYCGVILACDEAHDIRRAREWTDALSRWCERQPDLVAFTGRCLVHRAEIMELRGTWPEALAEARRAGERALQGENPAAAGEAAYRRAEIHRLRGELDAAEEAYREASGLGREPQPGLALLRLAQDRPDAAVAAIRRLTAEASEPGRRVPLLPAYVEIMLATGDLEAARAGCEDLEAIAQQDEAGAITAMAAYCRGAVAMADDDPRGALLALRQAIERWRQLQAPYQAARARTLVGRACLVLGDEDSAELELESARTTFAELGAIPDLTRLDALIGKREREDAQGLTERELEVLRQVAAGATNKAIASELVVSVRTVDRHVSNIFAKLGVSSRAAATAYAHQHRLV